MERQLACRRLMNRRAWIIGAAVFFVTFGVRFFHLDARSIWMDEDAQASAASKGIDASLPGRSAKQQQPPLDYVFESIGLRIFGWNEYGARMHAAVLGAGAASAFYFLLTTTAPHPSVAVIGTILFILDPHLVRYSQEGRPISCGVFFSVLWLIAMFRVIQSNRALTWKRAFQYAALSFSASFAFLMSVGFQPLVFLAASGISLIGAFAFFPMLRKKIAIVLGAAFAAFLASIPVLLGCILKGGAYVKPLSFSERLLSVATNVVDVNFGTWAGRLVELMGHLSFVAAVVIPLGTFGIARFYFKDNTRATDRFTVAFFLLFALIYPFALNGLFFGLVRNHSLVLRYYLTAVAPLLALLSLLGWRSFTVLLEWAGTRSAVWYRLVPVLFLAAFSAGILQSAAAVHSQYKEPSTTDWRSFYQLVKATPKRFGAAYLINLVPDGKWGPKRFYATKFYYRKEDGHPVDLRQIETLISDVTKGRLLSGDDIYFVVSYGLQFISPRLFDRIPNVLCFQYDGLSVIHWTLGDEVKKELFRVLDKIIEGVPQEEIGSKIVLLRDELKKK
jgi:hypothetical protein